MVPRPRRDDRLIGADGAASDYRLIGGIPVLNSVISNAPASPTTVESGVRRKRRSGVSVAIKRLLSPPKRSTRDKPGLRPRCSRPAKNYLDRLIPPAYASDAASGVYFLGFKSAANMTPRDGARRLRLVVECLAEKADREGRHRLARPLLHQGRDDRGIDSAGQERPERNVGDHSLFDRLAEPRQSRREPTALQPPCLSS